MARASRKTKRKIRERDRRKGAAVVAPTASSTASSFVSSRAESPPSESQLQPKGGRADTPPTIVMREAVKGAAGMNDPDWPQLDWPAAVGGRGAGFQVLVKRSVLNTIHRHGQSQSAVEVCGVLVGNVVHDNSGPFLLVEANIR